MKIHIDFEGRSMRFEQPIKVLVSYQLDQIKSHLSDIANYAEQGYYVVGYLAYESAMAFNHFNKTKCDNSTDLPLLLFGVFDRYHQPDQDDVDHAITPLSLVSNTDFDEYATCIAHIKDQIKQGNTYQTNYTIQFHGEFTGNPYHYYRFLQKNNQANYCAYIDYEDMQILSISPELFFKLENDHLITKPMKGTAARGKTLEEDNQQLVELLSEKNQAENMMIVDLLRNDLSRISKPGTVKVSELFKAEKYPTVWQLTSTIESDLKPATDLFDLFQALFPCGSITGAPKASTMEIIAQLEKAPRHVYCGTIGYITPYKRQAVFNIPIRTLTLKDNQACYGVGGGITWDSTQNGEYDELLQKTAILHKSHPFADYLLESMLLENGQFFLFERHLLRLADSANYFDYPFDRDLISHKLSELAHKQASGKFKVRIRLYRQGDVIIDIEPIVSAMTIDKIELSAVESDNVYLYHKTSNRQHFPPLTKGIEYLCHNQKGEITEFVYGNVVLFLDNQWRTPTLTSGLLAGTMRQQYLSEGVIVEERLLLSDILRAEKLAFINSVRKWNDIDRSVFNRLKRTISTFIGHASPNLVK